MKMLGKITGMELPTGPYTFRRGNGEALVSSSFISEAQRNLVLQHYSSAVLLNSNLSRYITSDVQAARRSLKPQTAIMRSASRMSRTIDRRRPRKLTDAQKAEVDRHPELRLLHRRQKNMFKAIRGKCGTIARTKGTLMYDQYQQACRDHRNTKRRHEEALLKEVIAKYKYEQPVLDIEQQLKSHTVMDDEVAQTVDMS